MSKDEFSKDDAKIMASIAAIIMLPLLMFMRAYVFSVIWFWFIVPLGATPLGIAHSMGVILLGEAFRGYRSPKRDKSTLREGLSALATSITFLLFVLGIGWLCSMGIQP